MTNLTGKIDNHFRNRFRFHSEFAIGYGNMEFLKTKFSKRFVLKVLSDNLRDFIFGLLINIK